MLSLANPLHYVRVLARAPSSLRNPVCLAVHSRTYARRPPPSKSDKSKTEAGDNWIRETFTTGVQEETPQATESTSLGGIFDDEPLPDSTLSKSEPRQKSKATAKKSVLEHEQLEASKQPLLPVFTPPHRIKRIKKPVTEFRGRTAYLTASVQKVNPLTRLIAGKPIDWAILQMRFNEKKRSKDIEELLVKVKADVQRVRPSLLPSMVVGEIWVAKGPFINKRIDIKGRGRYGIMQTRTCRVFVVVKPGETIEEQKAEKRRKQLKRIVSAAMVREDVPLRNMGGVYRW